MSCRFRCLSVSPFWGNLSTLWKPALAGFAFCFTLGLGGMASAQTLQTFVHNGSFTYGNDSFQITNCSFGVAVACTNATNISVIGVSTGRGGTEIELAPISVAHSYIYQSAAAGPNNVLSFTLKIIDKAGSGGLSSISNILTGSATRTADNSLISASLSGFTNVTKLKTASITSDLGSLSSLDSFAPTQGTTTNPVGFNVNINYNSTSPVGTLTLTNIKLLLTPAPEPASIALFATGITGLVAIRRRSKRRLQPAKMDA